MEIWDNCGLVGLGGEWGSVSDIRKTIFGGVGVMVDS